MSGDFLSRWSRRKREVERREIPEPPPEENAAEPLPEGEERAGEITPEEIAALPPLEELTAETDITAFLRKGVPEALKNAALRRIWSLDPAIRDHIGDARDYAYDWNIPGGVPGNGPLLPSDDVSGMLKRIFGDGPPPEREGGLAEVAVDRGSRGALSHDGEDNSGQSSEPSSKVNAEVETAAHDQSEHSHPNQPAGIEEKQGSISTNTVASPGFVSPDQQRNPEAKTDISSAPRRHGGAMPV